MKVIEYFECEEYFYIVMEYCSGGEMFVGVKDLIL
jgi:serine/threonine protein kinase